MQLFKEPTCKKNKVLILLSSKKGKSLKKGKIRVFPIFGLRELM